jgi:hypothetical protein
MHKDERGEKFTVIQNPKKQKQKQKQNQRQRQKQKKTFFMKTT